MILIGSEVNAPVAEYCGLFDEIIVKPEGQLFSWICILWNLRHKKICVTFDLNHSVTPHTLFACLVINSKHVATPHKDGRWGVQGEELELFDLMPARHPDGYARPIAEIYLDIAKLLKCSVETAFPYPISSSKCEREPKKLIILNHRGNRASMQLSDNHVLNIARLIKTIRPSYKIRMMPVRSDYERMKRLMKNESNVRVMPPSQTILPVVEAIRFAALVITPDTALVHIASAFSKPLIAVYANEPALFEQWKPLNKAPTVTLFATSNKGLEGYDFQELAEATTEMTSTLPI